MANAYEEEGQSGRLSDLIKSVTGLVRRRWLTLALVTGASFALATILILLMTPKYEATARIRIDPSRNPLSDVQAEAQASLAAEGIETEVTVLNSQELAREVVRRLNLQNDPEFTRGLDDATVPLGAEDRLNAITRKVMRNLTASRERLTYVIAVRFESEDPIKAARVANTFAETYLDLKVGSRVGTAERQSAWFRQRLEALGAEVKAADARVAQYRAQAGIVEGGASGTIVDQQVAPLSTQLATAQSEAAEARSKLAAARAQVARGGLDAVSEVRESAVIGDLRRQRAEVLRSMGEVSSRYGEKHPESVRVREQLASIDSQIEAEANRVIGSLQAQASAAEARAGSLRASMGGLEAKQARNTRASVLADSLEREAANKRAAYDRMAQLSLESTQGAMNMMGQAEIIDRAQPPSRPTSPNVPLLLALAAVAALALGIATITIQELLVSGLRTTADIEARYDIPVLAALPMVRGTKSPADFLIKHPTSLFAESLRIARASILGVHSATPPRIVALTSALPEEGKTTTSLSFARLLAMSGSRTLLIDCDVRRASLRDQIGRPEGPGLVEILRGKVSPDQAILEDGVKGLDLITIANPYFGTKDLFGGDQMATMLRGLRGQYEVIVLDLPPLMGLADARFIAALADAVALLVRWGRTPPRAVDAALASLRADDAKVVGAIYTMVDPSAEAIGGLYYSKRYAAYYRAA